MTTTRAPILGLLLAVAAALPGCGRERPHRAPAAEAKPPPAAPAARLVAPERVRHSARIAVTGALEARQSAMLAMSVPGTLARIAVRRGEEVAKGALLAALDSAAAGAGVRQAEAAVAAAKAQLALAEDGLARVRRIAEAEGASQAQLAEVSARRDLAAAQVSAAEAQLEQARIHLAHHELRAPFAGVVTQLPDGVGITVAPGVPVVGLVSVRDLVFRTSLTQQEAAGVRPGAEAAVSVPATGERGRGTVSAVVPAVDPETNRVPVEIAVSNASGRFLPGASARAELEGAGERDAWRVPAAALLQRGGGHAVWTAGGDGKALALPVRLLSEERDLALVAPDAGEWPAGLRVVEAPPLGLEEGAAIAEGGR